ncbi:unnamed protein product [Didymodactylos carnosus]|uniref:Uncharacterized protein n=1 Tax=Didymodactylos carnosus TaxID=1234261 RepID=A0A815V903_9BILA|nr:unnamed protein product [Didymodactylos carnosus]CAF1526993.1 unnamed protein product [Didymodactylos carnosus]CAF3903920.1 unnamed protein product [Didymodactylos carnosus]CAF4386095.1 unnamed protein product [Didymodactylos carnosus]
MEWKFIKQFSHINRISRQTRIHHTQLNRRYDEQLARQLEQLDYEREYISLIKKKEFDSENDRKKLLEITIKQIAEEKCPQLKLKTNENRESDTNGRPSEQGISKLSINNIIHTKPHSASIKRSPQSKNVNNFLQPPASHTQDTTIPLSTNEPVRLTIKNQDKQRLPMKNSENSFTHPSTTERLPTTESCTLFSSNCQFYPCQPVYKYTSFTNREKDRTCQIRTKSDQQMNPPSTNSNEKNTTAHDLFKTINEKRKKQGQKQLSSLSLNQNDLIYRYIALRKTNARLDEQSKYLKEQLADKTTYGYQRERQKNLSRAIARHTKITAKFCG